MKILYLVNTDPRNTSYGGEQRTHFIWEGLKKVGEVYTVIPVAHAWQERVDEGDQIRWVCFERRWTPGWVLRRIWNGLFPRIGLPCANTKERIQTLYAAPFDTCIVRYIMMANYVEAWKIAPMVLDVDDFESERYCSMRGNKMLRHHRWIIKALRTYEARVLANAVHAWVVNPGHIPSVAQQCEVSLLPNIPRLSGESLAGTLSEQQLLVTVGLMSHPPNYLGVDCFLRHHWGRIQEVFPNARYDIAGAGLPKQYVKQWGRYTNVRILGFVEDLNAFYRPAMCVLVPVDTGSGSCIKVLEALGIGRACLATPFAVRGIPPESIRSGNGIVLYHTTCEIIQGIRLLSDHAVRSEHQHQGYQYVKQYHCQDVVTAEIRQTLGHVRKNSLNLQTADKESGLAICYEETPSPAVLPSRRIVIEESEK